MSISSLVPPILSARGRGNSVGPQSLNFSVRKQENVRIEKENHKFAKRLFENNGIINKRGFDKDFIQ